MEQVLEVVRQETYGESSRSRAVYEALLEIHAKAERDGQCNIDVTWVPYSYEHKGDGVILTVNSKTPDTVYVVVYDVFSLDVDVVDTALERDGYELSYFRHPDLRRKVVNTVSVHREI